MPERQVDLFFFAEHVKKMTNEMLDDLVKIKKRIKTLETRIQKLEGKHE